MFDFFDLLSFLGGILRLLGLLVFGVAAGWFTLYAFRQPERKWQLQIAAFLGFMLFTALALYLAPAGGAGAFTLGAGGAILYWGTKTEAEPEDESKEEPEPGVE